MVFTAIRKINALQLVDGLSDIPTIRRLDEIASTSRWVSLVAELVVLSLFFLALITANQHMDS